VADKLVNDPEFAWWSRWEPANASTPQAAPAQDASVAQAEADASRLDGHHLRTLDEAAARQEVAQRQAAVFAAMDAAQGVAQASARLQRAKGALARQVAKRQEAHAVSSNHAIASRGFL
jgi:hypothetical protein